MISKKKVLITGCSGLVGTFAVSQFLRDNFKYEVVGVDLQDYPIKINSLYNERFTFLKMDLTDTNNLINLFESGNFDLVINLFGVKGSPMRAKNSPVDFLYPSLKINTEIINQCAKRNIWLVFVSSVGVYSPAEKFVEEDVWKTLPSENDWYPSWSKRIGELLLESYKIQYGYDNWDRIELQIGSGNQTEVLTIKPNVCPVKKYDPVDIIWLNRYGVWDNFRFFGSKNEETKIKRDTYQRLYGTWSSTSFTYNTYERGTSNIATDLKVEGEIMSDFLERDTVNWLEELLTSPQIYKLEAGVITPINITDSSFKKQIRGNVKLRQVSFKYVYSSEQRTQQQ